MTSSTWGCPATEVEADGSVYECHAGAGHEGGCHYLRTTGPRPAEVG